MAERKLTGPIKGALYIHRAILTESRDFLKAATSLTHDDANGPAALKERLAAFERVLKLHEDGEDLTIFPPIQEKYPHIAETYEFDHRTHRSHGAELATSLTELDGARGGRRQELVKQVGEQAVAFDAYMNLHIEKENVLLFPTYDEMFAPEEQMAHGKAAEGKIEPAAMAAAVAWMFQRLEANDREDVLREFIQTMPPPAFAGLSKGLEGAVSASEWQEMVRRIPTLAPERDPARASEG
jgi:hemerythrin-like domain-containing protein